MITKLSDFGSRGALDQVTVGCGKPMNKSVESIEATPACYLMHAREINSIAKDALRLETRDASQVAAKVSLGLSLQAAELAGKGMLRSLGHSASDIRRVYRNHDLLTLLRQVENELRKNSNQGLKRFHHFLLWSPTIDQVEYGNTVVSYLELHFARGASAWPRNYFYPDQAVFTGPKPVQALYVMVEYIIEVAQGVSDTLA